MRNYLTKRNNEGSIFNFFDDYFDNLFQTNERFDVMRTDVKEQDGNYTLSVDMPGFDKSEINVKLEKGYLTVSAEKSEKEEDEFFVRRERVSSCSRSYYVGDSISVEDVKAKYEKGILSLTFPKKNEKEIPSNNIEIL